MRLLVEIVIVALAAIRANALRSILTALGIIIGVAAVIAMVALGEGAQQRVENQIQALGTNVLTIRPGQQMWGGVRRDGTTQLTQEDATALRNGSDGLLRIAPEVSSRQQVTYLRYNSNNQIVGTWPEYFDIYNMALQVGRWFNQGEVQGRRRVTVVGSKVPEELGTIPELLLGQTIQIGGQPFEVIGVMEEKGEASRWFTPDENLFVPVTTAIYRLFGGRERLGAIYAATPTPNELDRAYGIIDRVLRREHRIRPGEEADFNISNSADFLATFNETNQTFTYLLAGIAAVSLLVGGIGIMNIMLVSVTERTREIGTRKALGATRKAILLQFLIEALVLCIIGGILGIAAGVGGAKALSTFAEWDTVVAMEAVYAALGFSVAIGLFFGIWPAQRAARLNPIEALRYE
ncbi:MAG: ABC transporter permease [Gemmatimonadales bacterium]|jgi:putative ABC transport system permease protein|nr:MAG: ABC transporter permease [Gemmatimonadales bacterium]